MSKIKLLLDVVGDLRSLADSVQAVADAMCQSEVQVESPAGPKVPQPAITLEKVRAVLAEKSRAGHTAEVRELLKKHGADKLSAIDPAEFSTLLAEAEVLGDG